MHRLLKTLALSILGLALGSLDYIVWFAMRLPFDMDAMTLELNHALLPWSILVRGFITGALLWTFLYFKAHCVAVNREESMRVVTRG